MGRGLPGLAFGPVVPRFGAFLGGDARFDLETGPAFFAFPAFDAFGLAVARGVAFAFRAFAFRACAGMLVRFDAAGCLPAGDRREDRFDPGPAPFRATGFFRGAAFFATFLTFPTPRLRLVTYVARVRQFFGIKIYKWCNECQLKCSQTASSPPRRPTCPELPS